MMLSRVAQGLFELGRSVERPHHITRILEVNHKMNLERSAGDAQSVWVAIADAFECGLAEPSEEAIYEQLVLSDQHEHSVLFCIRTARDQGRAMRDHISEEMWLHLNRAYLEFAQLTFDEIVRTGRSEFNRRVEVFSDAFHGLADNTMIRNPTWSFLQVGRLIERAAAICRILEIKRKSLQLTPEVEGAPRDVHQWQALLRSLSGYEPYRRAYDARIIPARVLEFVMQRPDFPRSLMFTLNELQRMIRTLPVGNASQLMVSREIELFREELRAAEPNAMLVAGDFDREIRLLEGRCRSIAEKLGFEFFTSLRPQSEPITAAPGAALVPQ